MSSNINKIYDLSHTIESAMPIFPGATAPKIIDLDLYDKYGVYVKEFSFDGHIGTHLDTPRHILNEGPSIDTMDVSRFYGSAVICDCRNFERYIDISILDTIDKTDFIILNTGFYHKWGDTSYFENFPVPSPELAQALGNGDYKGIAIDTVSMDPIDSKKLENHHALLGNGKIIIENITNLDILPSKYFTFSCLPLKIGDGDGSPIRAVALCD